MIVLEMKAVLKPSQCTAIDDAIRTVQFIISGVQNRIHSSSRVFKTASIKSKVASLAGLNTLLFLYFPPP
jgi:hypothetical protein